MGKAIKWAGNANNKIIENLIQYFNLSKSFSYTGDVQNFICPVKGVYKITIKGGSGGAGLGGGSSTGAGGQGGTTVGYKLLNKNDILYICIGGQGANAVQGKNSAGGYNGGGLGT